MTRPIKSLAAFVATLALFYLFGAFVAWDWSLGEWPPQGRFLLALIATPLCAMSAVFTGQKP